MQREIVLGISAVAVLLAGCLDRKRINADASAGADAGAVALDAGEPSEARSDGKGSTEPGGGDARDIGLSAELPGAGEGGMPADSSAEPPLGGDAPPDPGPDSRAATDLGADLPMLPDAAPDLPLVPDVAEDGARLGCVIGGQWFGPETMNPSNPCQSCQPSFAVASWTTAANGATCGTGSVCSSGACQSGCWIDGVLVPSGATHPTNPCQLCKPVAATGGWSTTTDGTSCGAGKICGAGACQAGCFIGGVVYASGALNPSNSCQSCVPERSASEWHLVPAGCASLAAGDKFTCAVVRGGAKCWGDNSRGALGAGEPASQLPYTVAPLAVSGLGFGVQAVTAGGSHACALMAGGVRCWGDNLYGALGDGGETTRDAPVQVAGLTSGVRGIAAGGHHTCALLAGQVECWGWHKFGQLGSSLGDMWSLTPVVAGVSGNLQAIAAGAEHSCVLVDGGAYCWGGNYFGQLGDGSTRDNKAAVLASGAGVNVSTIAAGGFQTCALSDGSLLCWGQYVVGQTSDGTVIVDNRSDPTKVQGFPSRVDSVACGSMHACAVSDGEAWCWGHNSAGQLGDGTTNSRSVPVQVLGLASGVQAIAAGEDHTCALTASGVKCWGANLFGQLGNNSTTNSLAPVSVLGL